MAGRRPIWLRSLVGHFGSCESDYFCEVYIPETARGLAEAFGTSAELWLNLESAYQLSHVKPKNESVPRRARLYDKAPVREMIKRHWIEGSHNIDELEERVKDFFSLPAIEQEPQFWTFAARTSFLSAKPTPAQMAWLFRAQSSPMQCTLDRFTDSQFEQGIEQLKYLLMSPDGWRNYQTTGRCRYSPCHS